MENFKTSVRLSSTSYIHKNERYQNQDRKNEIRCNFGEKIAGRRLYLEVALGTKKKL